MGRLDPSASMGYRVAQSAAGHITQNEPKMREIEIKVSGVRFQGLDGAKRWKSGVLEYWNTGEKEKDIFIATPERALLDAFYLMPYGRYSLDLSSLMVS